MTPLLGVTLFKTLSFWVYGMSLRIIEEGKGEKRKIGEDPALRDVMLSGMISGMVNSVVMSPTDRIKILLQLQRTKQEILKAENQNLKRAEQVIHFQITACLYIY